jgi:hypothetical protein
MRADDWHFAVLVRDGSEVRLHADGQEGPEIAITLPAQSTSRQLSFGLNFQSKLDEVAVFNRDLTPVEISASWRVSGKRK